MRRLFSGWTPAAGGLALAAGGEALAAGALAGLLGWPAALGAALFLVPAGLLFYAATGVRDAAERDGVRRMAIGFGIPAFFSLLGLLAFGGTMLGLLSVNGGSGGLAAGEWLALGLALLVPVGYVGLTFQCMQWTGASSEEVPMRVRRVRGFAFLVLVGVALPQWTGFVGGGLLDGLQLTRAVVTTVGWLLFVLAFRVEAPVPPPSVGESAA